MSDLEEAQAQVAAWLRPLDDEAAPCGPDLEYDNDFLALTQAAQGKPDSQFGEAEPPDWRSVRSSAAELLDRSRDLRLAVFWLRAGLHIDGYRGLNVGLQLVTGLIEQLWEPVHPLPDPDDGDPYARVNALAVLRETEGLIGDLRKTVIVQDRAVGRLEGRAIELAAGLSQPVGEEAATSRSQVEMMVAAVVERQPELRAAAQEAINLVRALQSAMNDKLGSSDAPDLKPLQQFVNAVASVMPSADDGAAAGDEEGSEAGGSAGQGGGGGRGLSGGVNSRAEALRAIDMVCEYLERAEPSNPAPLFLRRARQLVNHNFLQLMKELAPNVMPDMAHMFGIDPDTVETPERS